MRRSTRTLTAAFALSAAVALTACGDRGDDTAARTASTAAAPSAGAATDCAAQPGTTVTVEIGDFTFAPDPVRVHPCDQVVWHNGHDQAHTSSADAGARWNTGNIAPSASSAPVPFDQAGTYAYHCALHPFMKATVEVA
jgi:plastocyanin